MQLALALLLVSTFHVVHADTHGNSAAAKEQTCRNQAKDETTNDHERNLLNVKKAWVDVHVQEGTSTEKRRNQVRKKSERGFYEGSASESMENENGVETRITKHLGVEIRELSNAETCENGQPKWMVFVDEPGVDQPGCNNAFLAEVAEKCSVEIGRAHV